MTDLGFEEYIPELKSIGDEAVSGRKERINKKSRKSIGSKSEEQLAREQAEKFALARTRTGSTLSTINDAAPSMEDGDGDELLDDDDDDEDNDDDALE